MSNALTTQQQQRSILDLLKSPKVADEVAMALPKYLTPERMIRIACTAVSRNPKLAECTPQSLLGSLMQASAMGIEPDGRNGHLIPRWNSKAGVTECQFQADYKGLIALVRKNENVSDIYADLVCDNDHFKLTKGLHRDLVHDIDIRKPRGRMLGAYAVIQFRDGGASFEFMAKEEIDAIRARSQSANAGPWVTDYNEMAKKTVLKRLLKLADLSPDTAERIALDVEYAPPAQAVEQVRLEPAAGAGAPVLLGQGTAERAPEPEPERGAPATATATEAAGAIKERKARATKQAKAVEVPAEPAAQEDAPLPGAEPDPAHADTVAPPPTSEVAQALLERLKPYTQAQILHVLIPYHIATPTMKSLDEVPDAKIERCLDDIDTMKAELAEAFK